MHASRVLHAPPHARALRLLSVFKCECVCERKRESIMCVRVRERVCVCMLQHESNLAFSQVVGFHWWLG
jgi:hypothetical protein